MPSYEQPETVMLVDDDPIANHLHHHLLQESGLVEEVMTFLDAAKALKALQEQTTERNTGRPWRLPDIILLNLKMPGLEGFDFLDIFHQFHTLADEHIQLYVVSSSVHPSDLKRASAYPIAGMITKPLTRVELQGILRGERRVEQQRQSAGASG